MGKHDLKAKAIILERLLRGEAGKILAGNVLEYSDEFPLDDFDLVYKKWVTDQIALIELGANTFFGYYDTLAELEAQTDVPEGGYAYVGTGATFKIYFYDLFAESWKVVQGEKGDTGEVDLSVTDLRYLRKDIPETVTEPLTVQTLILPNDTPAENPVFYLGVLADGTVVPVNIATVTGDKNFVFNQETPALTWTVAHNMGKLPSVTVQDSANSMVLGSINYIDVNNLSITFSAPISGRAVLN